MRKRLRNKLKKKLVLKAICPAWLDVKGSKISEVVDQLNKIREVEGNIDVALFTVDDTGFWYGTIKHLDLTTVEIAGKRIITDYIATPITDKFVVLG